MAPPQAWLQQSRTRPSVLRLVSVGFLYPDALWRTRFPNLVAEAGRLELLPPGEILGLEVELRALPPEDLEAEHFRLFGPNPACPLDLAHHLSDNPFEQTRKLAELGGFFTAFGVEFEGRPDHLPALLEFLGLLELKRLNAIQKGSPEGEKVTRDAVRTLAMEFLVPALRSFRDKLDRHKSLELYRRLAWLALSLARTAAGEPSSGGGGS